MNSMELLINVQAEFLHKKEGGPVHGASYIVRLFDKDPLNDDFLGETTPDHEGRVHFVVHPGDWRKKDLIRENAPDFYITVLQDGTEIFKTPVAVNFNFDTEGNFNAEDGEWIDLGTFLI